MPGAPRSPPEPRPPASPPALLRTTLLLLPAQLVFRAGEAVLPLVLALGFGRSHATDVYTLTAAAFVLAAALLFGAFQDSALVPIYLREKLERPAELPAFLGALAGHAAVAGAVASVAVTGAALAWFRLRLGDDDFRDARLMAAPFSVLLLATATKAFFATLLNADQRFLPYPLASAAGTVALFAVVAVFGPRYGVVVVPFAQLAGELVAAGLLAFVAIRYAGVRLRPSLARPEPLRRLARLVSSEIAGSAVARVNPVVDQAMAGLAAVAGGGTLLKYAGDVATVPTSLLQASLLPVLLAHVATHHARRDLAAVRATVRRGLAAAVIGLGVAALVLYVARRPLLRLVFLHGHMDPAGVEHLVALFPMILVGLPPFGALLVLARAHVALENGRIMPSMGLLNASLNAALNLALVRALGLPGIALATSLVSWIVAGVFLVRLRARMRVLAAAHAAAAADAEADAPGRAEAAP